MIGDKQNQHVGDGATAVQAKGNVTIIHQGMDSREVIGLIRDEVFAQMRIHHETTKDRMNEFQEKLIKEFSDRSRANTKAFSDPDFVQTVEAGFKAHARSGDESVSDTLVNLIARRSQCGERNRLALSINQAIQVAADLTIEEFSALAFIMVVRHTTLAAHDFKEFIEKCRSHIIPLLPNLPASDSSFRYMEALRCGVVSSNFRSWSIDSWAESYKNVFNSGFDFNETLKLSKSTQLVIGFGGIIGRSWVDVSKVVFKYRNDRDAQALFERLKIPEADRVLIRSFQDSGAWKHEEFSNNLKANCEEIFEIYQAWNRGVIGGFEISTLGMAIGHAYLRHATGFDADLSIWIK